MFLDSWSPTHFTRYDVFVPMYIRICIYTLMTYVLKYKTLVVVFSIYTCVSVRIATVLYSSNRFFFLTLCVRVFSLSVAVVEVYIKVNLHGVNQ